MAIYTLAVTRTASSTLSVCTFVADNATPRRLQVMEINFGSSATPANNAFLWQLQRCTAAGTGSAVTPQPIDPADAAALFDALQVLTVDPTLTAGAIPLTIPLNQQSTFRWTAVPGAEPTSPATGLNGFALRTPTSSAVVVDATLFIKEL